MILDIMAGLPAEPEEGVLNDIAGPIEVTEETHGITQQGYLEFVYCLLDPL